MNLTRLVAIAADAKATSLAPLLSLSLPFCARSPSTARARAGKSLVPTEWKRREILGAHKQSDGKNWVGIHVPVGRAYPDEVSLLSSLPKSLP
jgi:hypothetical protein